jgi:uncharacterized protein (TIGR02996 family)
MHEEINPDKPSVYNNLNTTSQEVASFLAAIEANPDDDTNRLVFADWLDDHFPDLHATAEWYRSGARKWMEDFVEGETTCTNYSEACEASFARYRAERDGLSEHGLPEEVDFDYVPFTVADALKAGHAFLDSDGDDHFTQMGEEGLRDKMYRDAETTTLFWSAFSVLTGRAVDPAPEWAKWGMSPFSCSC